MYPLFECFSFKSVVTRSQTNIFMHFRINQFWFWTFFLAKIRNSVVIWLSIELSEPPPPPGRKNSKTTNEQISYQPNFRWFCFRENVISFSNRHSNIVSTCFQNVFSASLKMCPSCLWNNTFIKHFAWLIKGRTAPEGWKRVCLELDRMLYDYRKLIMYSMPNKIPCTIKPLNNAF